MGGLFTVWATSLAFDAGRYVVTAGVAFTLFWVWGRERFRHRLVNGAYARAPQLRRELAYSASTALVFSVVGTCIWYGTRGGVFRVYDDWRDRGAAYFALTLVLLPVLHDAYFYWTHRAMHHPLLFKRVHRVHHMSNNPSPWAAYAFAPVEAIAQALYVPLILLVLPVHAVALFVFLAFMIVRNVLGHLGLELFPRRFVRSRWTSFSTTTTHHCMHHRRVDENYGLYFTWWDRWMGTMGATYEETFERVASAPRGRVRRPAVAAFRRTEGRSEASRP
jgi:sterol desaturase/sphingolipid hydroxylase (fatty acid hydroxylase superfamily)